MTKDRGPGVFASVCLVRGVGSPCDNDRVARDGDQAIARLQREFSGVIIELKVELMDVMQMSPRPINQEHNASKIRCSHSFKNVPSLPVWRAP